MLFLLLRVGKGSWPLPAVCKETADKVTAAGRALEEEAHATWVYTVGVRKRDREGKKVPVAGLELDFWLWLSPWSSRDRITKKNSTSSLSHLTGQVLQPPSHLGAPLLNLHQFVNTCLVLGGWGGLKTRCSIWMWANKCWAKGKNSFPTTARDAVNLLGCQRWPLAPVQPAAYRDSQGLFSRAQPQLPLP